MDSRHSTLPGNPSTGGAGVDQCSPPRPGACHRATPVPLALHSLLCLGVNRAVDRCEGLRVPQLQDRLERISLSLQEERHTVGVGVVGQCMSPAGSGNALTLVGLIEILSRQLRRMGWIAIPGAMHAVGGEVFDVLYILTQVEPTATENLPHAIRG